MTYENLYSDTDSVFTILETDEYDDMLKEVEELCEKLNERYIEFCKRFNADEHNFLKIEPDKIYKRWLQGGSKKRYAGLLLWKDVDMRDKEFSNRLEIKGFETNRANTAKLTRKVQRKVLRMILKGRDNSEVREYINKIQDKFYEGELDIEMGIEGEMKRKLKDYKTLQAHHKAWRWGNNHGYSMTLRDPYIWWYDEDDKAKGIPIFEDEVPNSINIDYDRMWNRVIVKKLEPILKCIVSGQFSMNMFLSGRSMSGLGLS